MSETITISSKPRRTHIISWVILMLGAFGLMINNLPKNQVGAHYDDAAYITLARSLVQSDTYGLISFPGQPRVANYPFGYPLFLAPLAALQVENLNIYKSISILATLINASLLFWGWRLFTRKLSCWWGLTVTTLYLFSPVTIDLSGRVMSEPVFLTCYLMAMLVAELVIKNQPSLKIGRWLWPFGLGILLFMLPGIRTIGVVLSIGILFVMLLRMRKKFLQPALLILVGSLVASLLVVNLTPIAWSDLLPTKYLSDSQAALLVGLSSRLTPGKISEQPENALDAGKTDPAAESGLSGNKLTRAEETARNRGLGGLIQDYLIYGLQFHLSHTLRATVLPIPITDTENSLAEKIGLPGLPLAFGYLVSAVILFGYLRWFRSEGLRVFNFTAVLYFFALLAWIWNNPRFLYPILPQLLTSLLMGAAGLLILMINLLQRLLKPRFSSSTTTSSSPAMVWNPSFYLAIVIALLSLVAIYKSVTLSDSRIHIGLLTNRTQWIIENTPPGTIFASEYPVIDYLYADRQTVHLPASEIDLTDLRNYLTQRKVNYILVAPKIAWMQPQYAPQNSELMTAITPRLLQLQNEGELQIVFSQPQQGITVFQVK